MNKALEHIKKLIDEHIKDGYADNESFIECDLNNNDIEAALNDSYDIGRYETLTNLYNELKRIGE